MSKYHANELLNSNKNDIRHWKYIKKIPVGKGYRYFYTWDEYRAYLADPTAELQKVGNKVQNEITNASKKSYQQVQSRGRKVAEKLGTKKSKSDANLTVGSIKEKNRTRDQSFRDRINNLAKSASEKWSQNKEAVRKSIENGKKKLEDLLNPIDSVKNKIKELKTKNDPKPLDRESLAKKYKYIAKKKINGKTVYFYSQDELNAWNKKQDYIKNEPKFMKDVKHSDVPYTSDEDAILVNPKFNDPWSTDYQVNCAECTAIYELRRRGYDVESNGVSGNDTELAEKYNTDKRYDLFYKDPEINRLKPTDNKNEAARELEREFSKYPPGSRGDISFKWDGYSSAHSIAWEVDSKGKVHFIDTQPSGNGNKVEYDFKTLANAMDTSTTYKRKDFNASDGKGVSNFFKGQEKVSSVRIVRTDNLQLKPEIKKICQDSNGVKNRPSTKPHSKYINPYTKNRNDTMTEKEIVTKYPNLYQPKQIKKYNQSDKELLEYDRTHITIRH